MCDRLIQNETLISLTNKISPNSTRKIIFKINDSTYDIIKIRKMQKSIWYLGKNNVKFNVNCANIKQTNQNSWLPNQRALTLRSYGKAVRNVGN